MASIVSDFATLWTVACQASLSMRFSKQEYWSGLPFPSPEDLPDPGIKPTSLMSPALAGGFFPTSATWETLWNHKKRKWKSLSCLWLWDLMDCSLPGSSAHWILQARILQWVAIPFSSGSSQPKDRTQVSHIAGGFFVVWATREATETTVLSTKAGSCSRHSWLLEGKTSLYIIVSNLYRGV